MKKIWNNIYFQLGLIIVSIYIIYSTIVPFIDLYELNEDYIQRKESLEIEIVELENMISVYTQGGVEKEKIIREQYNLSEEEEILFEFPE